MASVRKLVPEMAEKAEKEINEVPERIEKDLAYLKEWISQQPHLNAEMSDQWLIVFLRGCKYSLEKTKQKIDTFYASRDLLPEVFRNWDPTKGLLKEAIHWCTIEPIVDTEDPTRPFIMYYHQHIDPKKISQSVLTEVIKLAFILTELFLKEYDCFSVNGQVVVVDFELLTFSHLIHFTPSLIKKVLFVVEKIYPIRIKAVHFINSPPAWERTLKIVKAICTPKLSSRIFVHENIDTLWEHVPKRLITSDLGGEGPTRIEVENKIEKLLLDNREKLLEIEKYGTNEKLRFGSPQTIESFLGIEGSFRQLSVD